MRKKICFLIIVAFVILFSSLNFLSLYAINSDYEILAKNNLAANKYDWLTYGDGSAKTSFSENGMKIENFNKGGEAFSLYQTNKLDEFKLSMYANLNLKTRSDLGLEISANDYDFSNVYISFMIETDNPVAKNTCPWNGNKAYFSVCFEELQGHDKTILYINECWNSSGATRVAVKTIDTIDFNDGKYHSYDLNVEKATINNKKGKTIKLYFDGVLKLEYFAVDGNRVTQSADGEEMYVNFTAKQGYVGFWADSDLDVGMNSSSSNCFIDINKLKIENLENSELFEQCAAPDFPINTINFAPSASYETGEMIEIKLDNLFSYEGDQSLAYKITSQGEKIGEVKNGYWTWIPDKVGTFYVDIMANVENKSSTNYLTIRVVESKDPYSNTKYSSKNCSSTSFNGSFTLIMLVGLASLILLKQSRR